MGFRPAFLFLPIALITLNSCAAPASSPVVESEPSKAEATQTNEPTAARTPTPLPARKERDIEYVPGGGAYQSLDVYLPPEGDGPFITFLAIHGGAFRARSKAIYNFIGNHLAAEGYAFVSTNYRLSQKASYPAQVEDVFCALAWIQTHQDVYGFDPANVFVWGGSAGGYLAGMVGTVESPEMYLTDCPHELPEEYRLAGMILFYGFYDFANPASIEGFPAIEMNLEPYWGAAYEELSQEQLEEMSPMSWIDGSEPPALIMHGTADNEIPSWMSEQFAEALSDAGVEVELILFEGARHAFELQPLDGPEMARALEAIKRLVSDPTGG